MADHTTTSNAVTCPLCMGHGTLPKEQLVARSRDLEFRELLVRYWDDATSGERGGLENPFESREESCAVSTAGLHGSGAGVPKE